MPGIEPESRIRGAWYGVFVGDALGTTLEFNPKPRIRPGPGAQHRDITGGGPFALEPGDWTDDGAMTLALAKALAGDTPPEMNTTRQLEHYVRWRREGFCSSNGRCFDIGMQTADALDHFARTGEVQAPYEEDGQGNGSLMRAVPVPIWLSGLTEDDFTPGLYREASRTTHNSAVCDAAVELYSTIIHGLIRNSTLEAAHTLALPIYDKLSGAHPELGLVGRALKGDLTWEEIAPTGWVVHSLAVAFWALGSSGSFEEGMIEVVNLCGDADTNGAIYGGLAGAVYGVEAIPERWTAALKRQDMLEEGLQGLLGA